MPYLGAPVRDESTTEDRSEEERRGGGGPLSYSFAWKGISTIRYLTLGNFETPGQIVDRCIFRILPLCSVRSTLTGLAHRIETVNQKN